MLLALRLGLYQLRYLERVPTHAAVSESVEMVKRAKKHSAAPLVNAVLRRAARDANISGDALTKMLPAGCSPAERLAILNSHPTWLVDRWMTTYGPENTLSLLEANNRPPRLCCAVLDATETNAVADSLRQAGLEVSPSRWLHSALTISGANPTSVTAFQQGRISLQDEASQMVARLVDARPGQTVLDLCAAPGGKTILLARALGPEGRVIATDLHEHRLRSTRDQMTRTHTGNVQLLALDASRPLPFAQSFERILVDAPCSGSGTLGRNPEIRWRLRLEDLVESHQQQVAMLRNALDALAPGGRLVYSTCSLEPEENEQVVAEAISGERKETHLEGQSWSEEFHVVEGTVALAQHLRPGVSPNALFDSHGYFRTFPPTSGTDGFFAAAIERKSPR